MVVGSKGPSARVGPENPAGPNLFSSRDSRQSLSKPFRFQQVLSNQVACPDDLVHVPVPAFEDGAVGRLYVIEDAADLSPDRGHALACVDDSEVEILSTLQEDP